MAAEAKSLEKFPKKAYKQFWETLRGLCAEFHISGEAFPRKILEIHFFAILYNFGERNYIFPFGLLVMKIKNALKVP